MLDVSYTSRKSLSIYKFIFSFISSGSFANNPMPVSLASSLAIRGLFYYMDLLNNVIIIARHFIPSMIRSGIR